MNLVPTDFKQLPKRKRDFVHEYVRSGDAKASFIKVGYKDDRNAMNKARKLMRELARHIEAELGKYVTGKEMATMNIAGIVNLAENSTSDAVKLKAREKLLSLGGWDQKPEAPQDPDERELTNEELDRAIEDARKALAKPKLVAIN